MLFGFIREDTGKRESEKGPEFFFIGYGYYTGYSMGRTLMRGSVKMRYRFSKAIIVCVLSLGLLILNGLQPAQAVDKSRVFNWLLFLSGLGSSAAGVIIQGQANEAYDQYLHTATQSDMKNLLDDYEEKHQQSIIASRAGAGLVIGAILLSLVDAAYIPPPETEETPSLFGNRSLNPQIVAQNGEILLSIGRRF